VVLSIYDDDFTETLHNNFASKIKLDGINDDDLKHYKDPNYVNMMKGAIDYSDAIIYGTEKINTDVEEYLRASGKPVLEFQSMETYIDKYSDFYNQFLS
jgi:starch synthase